MCTSYESRFNEHQRFDGFNLLPEPEFDFKSEIYKDYASLSPQIARALN
jgi:hypothetical protein